MCLEMRSSVWWEKDPRWKETPLQEFRVKKKERFQTRPLPSPLLRVDLLAQSTLESPEGPHMESPVSGLSNLLLLQPCLWQRDTPTCTWMLQWPHTLLIMGIFGANAGQMLEMAKSLCFHSERHGWASDPGNTSFHFRVHILYQYRIYQKGGSSIRLLQAW